MEACRSQLEELEGFERVVVSVLKEKNERKSSSRLARLNLDFQAAQALEECIKLAAELKSGNWADKIETERLTIEENGMEGFYAEKKRTSEYYAKFSDATGQVDVVASSQARLEEAPTWSGEERHGKYLDLHALYNEYVNLKAVPKDLTYIDFLSSLGDPTILPLKEKSDKKYLVYLKGLVKYLESFHKRAQALVDLGMDRVEAQFEEMWKKGTVPGWEQTLVSADTEPASLVKQFTPEELAKELLARGLKSGGLPLQRAERLLLSMQEPTEEITKKLRKAFLFDAKGVACEEAKLQALTESLVDILSATKDFITSKQTRSYEELLQEEEEEYLREQGIDDDDEELYKDEDEDEDENKKFSDSKRNMPLDFDGQPMPMWFYKLNGLRVEYKCEICGNYTYKGRRNFDRHFQEWRHAHGMRLLGIPNTKHFHDITKIEEARALYAKLQSSIKETSFNQMDAEQVEDSEGNVYSRKTYLDLKRQGLVD
mmetsp:Transcript_16753/g.29645  ORF Transcript_16753/g.29645 Transcript_16753/m.29645 type:complete len:486 (+) Transcript_16753:86-1543(+)